MTPLDKITIKGFKSIKSLQDFELTNLNVLIGANGAGKTNFIEFFRMLRSMMEIESGNPDQTSLKAYTSIMGGSDNLLFNGPKTTKEIESTLMFGENGYRFSLVPTSTESFSIQRETRYYEHSSTPWWSIPSGQSTPELLKEVKDKNSRGHKIANYVFKAIESWKIYHFHDTSMLAPMRRSSSIDTNEYLRYDASNLAPYLMKLKILWTEEYQQIRMAIQTVIPFFNDFLLKEDNAGNVKLLWTQKGSDYPLNANHFSDGSIRFICLAVALMQPHPPATILIDEPELGLHPYAIVILSEIMKAASNKTQLIISTQSPALIDNFSADNIVVVNRKEGASVFERLKTDELKVWMEDYSLGELWRKNVITASPTNE